MHAAPRSLALVFGCSLAGCLPPPLAGCEEADCAEASTGSSGAAATVPTSGGGVQTATGEATASSTGEPDASTGAATTGAMGEAPEIVKVEVDPNPIADNGLIAVEVETVHADGVRMALDDGAVIELEVGERDRFAGQIPAFTGLLNGDHSALLTPWRSGIEGTIVAAPYTIDLPAPGSQGPWKPGDGIGGGTVAALAVLPDRRVVELGNFAENGEPRCYLRRRDGDDASWPQEDFLKLLAGAHCTAVDLQIDPVLGTMHVLVERKGGDGVRWWLGEIASWGKGAKEIAVGALGDKGLALALAEDGTRAVCGGVAGKVDVDAAAWLLRPGEEAKQRLFDYVPEGEDKAHQLSETARDCVFAGETLVLVGEANGRHGVDVVVRDRYFILEHDIDADATQWTIAGPGPGSDTQSHAFAVDVDADGRYLLAGSSCGDVCDPAGEVLVYLPGGKLEWQATLGPLGSALAGPHDIAWSPAGYLVVALAAFDGQSSRFKVQAFKPGVLAPQWTYLPLDMNGFQVALALAIGRFGEVYAGGIAEGNFPAVAYIPG